jgi:hypothetical protein
VPAGYGEHARNASRGEARHVDPSIPESEFDTSKSVKALEITWHRSPPSYDPSKRTTPLSYDELCTLTECEGVVETLTLTETVAWVCDLIKDKLELKIALHACMDALHAKSPKRPA